MNFMYWNSFWAWFFFFLCLNCKKIIFSSISWDTWRENGKFTYFNFLFIDSKGLSQTTEVNLANHLITPWKLHTRISKFSMNRLKMYYFFAGQKFKCMSLIMNRFYIPKFFSKNLPAVGPAKLYSEREVTL